LARPEGTLDGWIRAEGTTLENMQVGGWLELNDVSVTVRDPFARIEDVGGRIELSNEAIRITELTTRDRDGSLRVDGRVGLSEWSPTTMDMRVRADDYPIRKEGIIFATVNGDIRADGQLDADPRRLDVVLRDLAVALPDQMGHDVRGLNEHPEVIYEDEPGFDRSLSVQQALAKHRGPKQPPMPEGAEEATPLHVNVRSDSPFWVRRSEFAVQLELDLNVQSKGPRTTMTGSLQVRRGFLDLLGKTFQLRKGKIDFGGAVPVDPKLGLTAVHELPSGYPVTVHIGGHLSSPELSFSTEDPRAQTDADVIALLMGVRGQQSQGETDAESQARSMLAGMMAGLVGSLARREFGQYIPVLAIESGGTADSTRVRAGFQADALIPESWRDVVLGLYIQGSVGGGGQQTGGGASAGGFLELFFPHQISTAASWEQSGNWSLDLLWEP
jgi:translocation and assembly module TamB